MSSPSRYDQLEELREAAYEEWEERRERRERRMERELAEEERRMARELAEEDGGDGGTDEEEHQDDDEDQEQEGVQLFAGDCGPTPPARVSGPPPPAAGAAVGTCPLCMDPWTPQGPHRMSCIIPCGHVYGRSCLEKWLTQQGNQSAKCPQCGKKFKQKDIFNLYAQYVAVPNSQPEKVVPHDKMSEEMTKNGVLLGKGNCETCRQVGPLPLHSKLSSSSLPAHPPPLPHAPSTFPNAPLRKELPAGSSLVPMGAFRFLTRRIRPPKGWSPTPAGSDRAPTPAGSDRAPTPTGSDRAQTPAGSDRAPTPAGSDRALTPAGSDRAPTPAGSDRAPPPPPPAMPPPSVANRLAAYWVVDALASDESLDFSVLSALVDSLGTLEGAPETTRERVALRCLQQLSSVIPTGGDAVAMAGVPRLDGTRSCQDVLFQLTKVVQVGSSGKLDKDLLPPFSPDIQEAICRAKLTLPEICIHQLDLGRMELDVAESEGRPLKRLKGM